MTETTLRPPEVGSRVCETLHFRWYAHKVTVYSGRQLEPKLNTDHSTLCCWIHNVMVDMFVDQLNVWRSVLSTDRTDGHLTFQSHHTDSRVCVQLKGHLVGQLTGEAVQTHQHNCSICCLTQLSSRPTNTVKKQVYMSADSEAAWSVCKRIPFSLDGWSGMDGCTPVFWEGQFEALGAPWPRRKSSDDPTNQNDGWHLTTCSTWCLHVGHSRYL